MPMMFPGEPSKIFSAPHAAPQRPPGQVDLYVLAGERSIDLALAFIDRWTPGLREVKSSYEFPQFSADPSSVYFAAREMAAQLVVAPNHEYAIYWTIPPQSLASTHQPPAFLGAMLFFNRDASMVAGLSFAEGDRTRLVRYLEELASDLNAQYGYCLPESPPAGNAALFRTLSAAPHVPRMHKGRIHLS
jgi:hypothetical protein